MRYVARALSMVIAPGAVPGSGLSDLMVWALRHMVAFIGLVFIVIAVPVAILTPIIPVGLPLLIIGIVLLVNTSDRAKRIFLRWVKRYPLTSKPLRRFMSRRYRWWGKRD